MEASYLVEQAPSQLVNWRHPQLRRTVYSAERELCKMQ